MKDYILVMDQGTTGSRGVVYNREGDIVAKDYKEFEKLKQKYPWQ
mgnify:CR=1 FL=1